MHSNAAGMPGSISTRIRFLQGQDMRTPVFIPEEWALIGITMIWGATFLIIRGTLAYTGPLFFVGLRFASAALIMLPLSFPVLRGLTRREVLGGALVGVTLFASFALQTWGLETITASKSAFITAFYVPLVPLLQWLLLRRPPQIMAIFGMALAFPGVMLLSGTDGISSEFGKGELLTALCAVAVALEIIIVSVVARGANVRRLTVVQVAVASALSFAFMPAAGEHVPDFSWIVVASACGLGIASALIQCVINWAQKRLSPTRATLIYTGEPLWGGLFGYLAGERLAASALLGGALIIAGILASERPLKKSTP